MAQSSNYNSTHLLLSLTGNSSAYSASGLWTPPARYLTILTTVPLPEHTGGNLSEASYSGYTRVIFDPDDFVINSTPLPGGGMELANVNPISFPVAGAGASDVIIAFAWCDDITVGAGNMILFGTVNTRTITAANDPVFEAGDLKFIMK